MPPKLLLKLVQRPVTGCRAIQDEIVAAGFRSGSAAVNSKKRTTVGSGKRKQTAPATPRFNPHTLLTQIGDGRTVLNYKEGQAIFAQGDPADAIFYIQK